MNAPDPSLEVNLEANRVAQWCDKQCEKEGAIAEKQIRLVLITILAGISLLLAMPRLIYQIDYLGRTDSLPKNIIEKAGVAQNILNKQLEETNKRVESAGEFLDDAFKDDTEARYDLEEDEDLLNIKVAGDFAFFRHIPDTKRNFLHVKTKTIQTHDGSYIAVGYRNVGDRKIALLMLHSAVGNSWNLIPLEKNGMEMLGQLAFLIQASDGTFIAVGHESTAGNPDNALLLRSSDGEIWTPIHPEENGEKLKGRLQSIIQVKDGSFIAAGYESTGDNLLGTILLLRSSDGEIWTPIRPEENGEKIGGHLQSILQAKDGSFMAAGYESTGDNLLGTVLLLRSSDVETWTPIRPEEHKGKLDGRLQFIMQAKDNSFIAAGYKDFGKFAHREKLLLLRSMDGISWVPINIKLDGDIIIGHINSVHQLPDGRFIALGHHSLPFAALASNNLSSHYVTNTFMLRFRASYPKASIYEALNALQPPIVDKPSNSPMTRNAYTVLLLHSSDGISWIPVTLYKDGTRLEISLENLLLSDESSGFEVRVSNSWLKNLLEKNTVGIRNQIKKELDVSPDLIVSSNILPLLDKIRDGREAVEYSYKNYKTDEEYYDKLQRSIDSQQEAIKTFGDVTTELDEALRKTELLREGGQIATRFAIVGLLIYFVQLLVNRYRYHLRLAKFYKARAQALRLIIENSEEKSAFSNASLSDIAMALSPESIHFDKLSSQSLIYSNQANDGKVSK